LGSPGLAADSARAVAVLPKPEGCIGRITIPRVGVSAAILEGTGRKALLLGVGHVEGSAGPGAPGETVLAGHRDTVFRPLKDVRKDDLVWIDTERGSYVYRVVSTRIVRPHPIELAASGPRRELTLITCYPFHYIGSAPERYIITAQELGSD
jgi:sortase A